MNPAIDVLVRASDPLCEQDRKVVREVVEEDCYQLRGLAGPTPEYILDVGAHIGSFSCLAHSLWPAARIACVEACPENLETLRRNVETFGTVIQAACTYLPGRLVLLNSIGTLKVGQPAEGESTLRPVRLEGAGTATGASRVIPVEELGSVKGYGHVTYADRRPLVKVSIEWLFRHYKLPRIDLLKLDCEGSEFSILQGVSDKCLARIGRIVLEYHDLDQFQELLMTRFATWRAIEISRHPRQPLGIYRLENPTWPPTPWS